MHNVPDAIPAPPRDFGVSEARPDADLPATGRGKALLANLEARVQAMGEYIRQLQARLDSLEAEHS